MTLHESLSPLAVLIGTWRGAGSGEYPTIQPFDYTEQLMFTDVGKPFLVYQQRTWSPAGALMHTESGFVRAPAGRTIEVTMAQPTGQTELLEGELVHTESGFTITLRGKTLNSATAKTVDGTKRIYTLRSDSGRPSLNTTFAMAAVGVPMTHHLASNLTLQPLDHTEP